MTSSAQTIDGAAGARRWFGLFVGAVAVCLLVPFLLAAPAVDVWFESFEQRSGATLGVALVVVSLLAIDIVAPVPSSLVAAFAGVAFGSVMGSLLVFCGLTIGCMLGYAGALTAGRRMASGARSRTALAAASRLSDREGALALFVARPVPLLAEATVVVAGLTGMRWTVFLPVCITANVLVAVLFAGIPGAIG
jgi:uncharacterized membrane protein YdjX (TVP38/TMEM64 family)